MIQAPKQAIWQLITTTKGFSQWFPEIKADCLLAERVLNFESEGFSEQLAVFEYEEESLLGFSWADGRVVLSISETTTGETKLRFFETLPLTFPNLYLDLAGWYYVLQKLKAAAVGKTYSVKPERIKERAKELQQQLEETE
ncbi:SRPBCC family protein [Enterococcus sp. LJL128]